MPVPAIKKSVIILYGYATTCFLPNGIKTQQTPQRTRTTLHAMFYFTTGRCIWWCEEPHWHEALAGKSL